MSLNGLEKAILLSVSYSNVFSCPLNSQEIWLRLISKDIISLEKVKKSIKKLVSKGYLYKFGQYYSVINIDWSKIKKSRNNYSKEKLAEANALIRLAKRIPFIKAMVITGSLSVSNAKKNDDTDWLIITSKNTLWITRPLVLLLASFYGKRRERNGNHRDNSWCFNMFLTDESLLIEQDKRSVYSAYEVCQAKFVYDSNNVEQKFLFQNFWTQKYLHNFYISKVSQAIKKTSDKKQNNLILLLSIVNTFLYYIQYFYMRKRITREVVQLNKALFHPRNTKNLVFNKWKKTINNNI